MTIAITLRLPDQLYEQAKRLAEHRRQALEKLLVDELAEIIAAQTTIVQPPVSESLSPESTVEMDEAVERERNAYLALHPFLKKNFLGKHVAIYQGQLIDSDQDYDALYARINAKYPNVFVWLDTVSEEPIEIISFRSPVFIDQ